MEPTAPETMGLTIRPLTRSDLPRFELHFARHRAESGGGAGHFMPFAPDDPEGPKGLDPGALERPLTGRGWQRWFLAFADDGEIVGHVNLKGAGLKSALHRCELGIGIERPYRGRGLGKRLMAAAIDFALGSQTLAWIDLGVFAHNVAARALYRQLGFVEVGILADRFRVEGTSIDDVVMTLDVSGPGER